MDVEITLINYKYNIFLTKNKVCTMLCPITLKTQMNTTLFQVKAPEKIKKTDHCTATSIYLFPLLSQSINTFHEKEVPNFLFERFDGDVFNIFNISMNKSSLL